MTRILTTSLGEEKMESKIDYKVAIKKLWGSEQEGLEAMLRYIAESSETKIDDVVVELLDKVQGVLLN